MTTPSRTLHSETDALAFGRQLAAQLAPPAVIELVGDVGAGKTTLTRGLAEGLGITEPVTSPSFTISKQYAFTLPDSTGLLIHYDFYRLPDPGLMSEDLAESLSNPHSITVVEWADSVSDLLPENRCKFYISLNDDGSRTVTPQTPAAERLLAKLPTERNLS